MGDGERQSRAFERISKCAVRIALSRGGKEFGSGTGVIIGTTRQTRRAAIVTARHVVDLPEGVADDELGLEIQRYNSRGQVQKQVTFSAKGRGPTDFWVASSKAPGTDIAVIIAPALAADGSEFVSSIGSDSIGPVGGRAGPDVGSQVAWAGFPGLIESPRALGCPRLCYFQGVVSAFVDRDRAPCLVVDGHAMPGVSGGPLWFVNDDSGSVEIAGIVSQYLSYETPVHFHPTQALDDSRNQWRDRMPGLCFVQPCFQRSSI